MNLNFDVENDKKYDEMLASNAGGSVSDKDLPYVDSGIYQCEISSAFVGTATRNGQVEERINVTFIAYDTDGVTPVGKFTNNFTCNEDDKFFTKTLELCIVTGNPKGVSDEPLVDKDGNIVVSKKDGSTIMHYPALRGKKLIACVFRKSQDYVGNDGVARANYTLYGLYNMQKQDAREMRNNLPPASIGKTYAFLQKKIKEEQEQAAALANMGGNINNTYSMAKSQPQPQPQQPQAQWGNTNVAKPQQKPIAEPKQPNAMDNIPF